MSVAKASRKNHAVMQERMLAAATSIIETQGFAALSIRSLALALGCSIGTIYNYFVDFDDLVLRINATTIAQLDVALMQSTMAPSEVLPHKIVDAYFDFLEANPQRWRALFLHYPPPTQALPEWYVSTVDQIVHHVCTALEPHLACHEKSQRRTITIGLWASLHGLSMLDQQGKLATVAGQRTVRDIAHDLISATLSTTVSPHG